MNRLIISAVAGGLAVLASSAAFADTAATGQWKYTVGSNTDCSITINEDQTVVTTGTCPTGNYAVAHWETSGSNIKLLSASDELVAILKPKGEGFEGKRVYDSRKVALSR
ncbi:MAG: hypothetical protein GC166_03750 [Alphaproteobacteria bacterium]|nr:hypothetical protein [Alphaproteobacteria bacterium]